jgi:hypothetical protein
MKRTTRPAPKLAFRLLLSAAIATLALLVAIPPALGQPEDIYRPSRDRKQPEPKREQPSREKDRKREEGRELFRPGQQGDATGATWSIVLLTFRGEQQQGDAQLALGAVQNEWGLRDAFIEQRGHATVVAFGRYQDPADPKAQADLKRINEMERRRDDGVERPFELAFLAPPAKIPGTIPEFDLRNAQRLHGRWAIYTL